MFEHLGSLPDIQNKKKHWRHGFVLAFIFSLGVFFLTIITTVGPSSLAADTGPRIRWQSVANEQRAVKGSSPLQLFQLSIDSPISGVELNKIKLYVNGLYDPEYVVALKIYHQGIQIGTTVDLDEDGYITLDLDSYKLPAGSSQLLVSLPDSNILAQGTVLQFSIENRKDIVMTYGGKNLIAAGKFPLVSGVTQIVGQGDWQVYNLTDQSEQTVLDSGRVLIGQLALASGAEVLDLKKIVFGQEFADNKTSNKTEFILMFEGEIVGRAYNDQGKIVFDIKKPLATKNNGLIELELYANDLPLGSHLFSLYSLDGKGYISNKELTWSGPMVLSRVHARDSFPLFTNGAIDPSLRVGWNNVYNLKVKPAKDKLNIYKLTWYYKATDTKVRGAKIFVDHKYYPMDVVVKDNSIVAKAEWSNPLPVSEDGLSIQLMLDLNQSYPDSLVEVYLQNDILAGDPKDIWEDNIIWSQDNKLDNSYLLPNLPLEPMVLDYNID